MEESSTMNCIKKLQSYFNIEVLSTASESPWSNGITERHNAIIGNMLERILEENKCSMEVALAWAVSAQKFVAECVWV